jgi:hypothetical protein
MRLSGLKIILLAFRKRIGAEYFQENGRNGYLVDICTPGRPFPANSEHRGKFI